MTRSEFHTYFKVAMDKNSQGIAFGGYPALLDNEIDYWLDTALYLIIANKFTGNNYLGVPFEQAVKRIHDLEKLVNTDKAVSAYEEAANTNVVIVDDLFNDQRMYFVDAVLNFGDDRANIEIIPHEDAIRYKLTYDNNPWVSIPKGVIEDNKLLVFYDVFTMNTADHSVDITYIKYPTKISLLGDDNMTDIPQYMQYEIIDKAVALALENIEAPRSNNGAQGGSKLALNNTNE